MCHPGIQNTPDKSGCDTTRLLRDVSLVHTLHVTIARVNMERLLFLRTVLTHWLIIEPGLHAVRAFKLQLASQASRALQVLIVLTPVMIVWIIVIRAFDLTGVPSWTATNPALSVYSRGTGPTPAKATGAPFIDGSVCKREVEIEQGVTRHDCLAPNGATLISLGGKAGWTYTCCVEVEVGSAAFGTLRRVAIEYPWTASAIAGLGPYALPLGVGLGFILITGSVLLARASASAATQLAGSMARGVSNARKAMHVPVLIEHALDAKLSRDEAVIAVHISDLHQTVESRAPLEIESGEILWPRDFPLPSGHHIRAQTVALVQKAEALHPAFIAVTGDLTDLGKEKEMEACISAIREGAATCPIYAVPGNHDLTFNAPTQPDVAFSNLNERLVRVTKYLEEITPRSAQEPFVDYPRLNVMRIGYPHHLTVSVLLLNSNNYPSRHSFSGALGLLGEEQLAAARKSLRGAKGPLVVLVHHHVGLVSSPSSEDNKRWLFMQPKEMAMVALDTGELLQVLQQYARQDPGNKVLVLHGHRHEEVRAVDEQGLVHVYGSPSSTLGTEGVVAAHTLDGVPKISVVRFTSSGEWNVETIPLQWVSSEA
jgi:3',5'-cyclic AMP phosphodiesterase CpdA